MAHSSNTAATGAAPNTPGDKRTFDTSAHPGQTQQPAATKSSKNPKPLSGSSFNCFSGKDPKPEAKPVPLAQPVIATSQPKKPVSRVAVPSFYADGCFGGESTVYLDGGGSKPVSEVRKGDVIKCDFEGNTAEVKCVLAVRVSGGKTRVVRFENGLVITPMHPIMSEGAWALPKNLQSLSEVKLHHVFNFVLDKQHTMLVNNVICSVLGHVREGHTTHPFWGNWDLIVDCMQRLNKNGFENGLVEIAGTMREKNSGMVYGLKSVSGQLVAAEA